VTTTDSSGIIVVDMRTYKLFFTVFVALLTVANGALCQVSGLGPQTPVVTTRTVLSVDKIRPGDTFQFAVEARVKPDYHIGAQDKDALYPAKLTLTAPKGITFDAPIFPEAQRKSFPFAPDKKLPVYEGDFVIVVKGHAAGSLKPGTAAISSELNYQACRGDQCYPPSTSKSTIDAVITASGSAVKQINPRIFAASHAGAEPIAGSTSGLASKLADSPLFVRFIMLYGLGLLLAFTPCVYPMYPITIGYFGTQGESRTRRVVALAAVYVLGIALTYSILGAIAATAGGMIGAAMQSPFVLFGIAAVLVLLALSMFGLYELQAPSCIQNRSFGRAGMLGALIMGLIFGVVAAPCVGPVVLGLMAYVAHLGLPLLGFLLFFALALGIGTPLFFLATFSAKLPVPGMWMVAVKKIAGFLLIGAAAYFITPVLPETIGRLLIPMVVIAAGIYLGFVETSIRASKIGSSIGRAMGTAGLIVAVSMAIPRTAPSIKWQPYQPAAVTAAAKDHKPMMIDFTAKWCAACRELEHGPFSDPKIIAATRGFDHLRVDGTDSNNPQANAAIKKFGVSGFRLLSL